MSDFGSYHKPPLTHIDLYPTSFARSDAPRCALPDSRLQHARSLLQPADVAGTDCPSQPACAPAHAADAVWKLDRAFPHRHGHGHAGRPCHDPTRTKQKTTEYQQAGAATNRQSQHPCTAVAHCQTKQAESNHFFADPQRGLRTHARGTCNTVCLWCHSRHF